MFIDTQSVEELRLKLRDILHTRYALEMTKVYDLDGILRTAESCHHAELCEDILTLHDLVPLNKSFVCQRTIPAPHDQILTAAKIVEDMVSNRVVRPDDIFDLSSTPAEAGIRLAHQLDIVGRDMPLARTMYLLPILRSNHVPFLKHIEVREHITTGIEELIEFSKEDVRTLQESFVVLRSPHPLPAITEWILTIPSRVNDPAKAKALALSLIQRLVQGVSLGIAKQHEEELEMYKTALLTRDAGPAGSC